MVYLLPIVPAGLDRGGLQPDWPSMQTSVQAWRTPYSRPGFFVSLLVGVQGDYSTSLQKDVVFEAEQRHNERALPCPMKA